MVLERLLWCVTLLNDEWVRKPFELDEYVTFIAPLLHLPLCLLLFATQTLTPHT